MSANGSYKPVPGQIPGTVINLSGMEFVMPPLNLDQVQQFEQMIPTLGKQEGMFANISEALPVIHAALSRNYPDLTQDELRPLLDMGNFASACAALVKSSGFVPAKPGEPQPASP